MHYRIRLRQTVLASNTSASLETTLTAEIGLAGAHTEQELGRPAVPKREGQNL
jgi:hypothetical protein